MRILADENCPRVLVVRLREAGRDVAWIREVARGVSDVAVLSGAQRQRRVILTLDKDFGDLALRRGLPAECGVILIRVRGKSPREIALRAMDAITSRPSWAGLFATVTETHLRIRPLPTR